MSGSNGEPSTSGIITTTTNPRQLSDGNGLNGGPGTLLGQGAADPIGLYGVTPVVQPAQPASHSVATTTAGSTTSVFVNTTFPGASGSSNYTVGDIVTALKAIGILAA